MKLYFVFLGIVLFSNYSQCQTSYNVRGEFATQSNGLMYSDKDMKVLRYIVDSLNLRFRKCEFNREFYSYPQGKVVFVEFESKTDPLNAIIEDLKNSIDLSAVLEKYKRFITNVDSTKTICQVSSIPSEGKMYFLEGEPWLGYDYIDLPADQINGSMQGNWAYEYYKKDEYREEYSISGRFFPERLTSKKIPSDYAKLFEYVHCMIDTNSTVMLASWGMKKNDITSLPALKKYIHSKMKYSVDSSEMIYGVLITNTQTDYALKKLREDPEFIQLLNQVTDECIKLVRGDANLERLVGELISKQKALTLKRSRLVVGSCSQDSRPREHALDIARLAAESHSWEVFLRSHLDIMNDRFERMSDGSYAWDGRKTYLKELEELDLNIVDLMLGLTLRADNLPNNHYYGTVWRIGWALTESKEQERFQKAVLEMMKNQELDEFNRGLIFLLYSTYLRRLGDASRAELLLADFKNKAAEFPESLQPYIKQLSITEEKE